MHKRSRIPADSRCRIELRRRCRRSLPALPVRSGLRSFQFCAALLSLQICAGLLCPPASAQAPAAGDSASRSAAKGLQWDVLPILIYDSDIGVGYGVKGKTVDLAGAEESFDVIVFNSSKGERWYRVAASFPDAERRQGTRYALAMDLSLDYDKIIAASFFGVGNGAAFDDREFYTREPFEAKLLFSRGLTTRIVAQAGAGYRIVRNFHFSDGSRLAALPPELNQGTLRQGSLLLGLRYDSRNSVIHPTRGVVTEAEARISPSALSNAPSVALLQCTVRSFTPVVSPDVIAALRLRGAALAGGETPVQGLLSLGGNATLRGYPQDRYLDRCLLLVNAELRFPIVWRFGGIAAMDAGKVWSRPALIDLRGWALNPALGLRFFFDTFVARLDAGMGRGYTGVYFNVDHVF